MISPLHFEENLSIDKYLPQEEAMFSAHMDIQMENEEFIPFDEDITKCIELEMF